MNTEAWRAEARVRLEQSGDMDAAWDADWMLCEALGCSRSELRYLAGKPIDQQKLETLGRWILQRMEGRPLQYVLGNTCFMGLDFKCDERALIPRQDTETLVELALGRMQGRKGIKVLDMCCGTGAIGLSVKYFRPDADVTLSDISADALELTKENMQGLSLSVRLRRGDLFGAVEGEKFDFVLSNPPYLTEKDMDELMREVRYEPSLALRGGADGLDFYRRIADGLDNVLNAGGEALLEIGMGQQDAVIGMLHERGFDAKAYKDLCGIERVIWARRR